MTVATALSLADLEANDPHASDRGGQERRFCCPLPPCADKRNDASHRALAVNTETGAWRCHRCGASGKLKDFWVDRPRENPRARSRQAVRRAFTLSEPPPPAAADPAWREHLKGILPLPGSPGAVYLAERGIPVNVAVAARVKYHPSFYWRPAVVFPAYDQAGELVAAEGRFLDKRTPKALTAGPKGRGVFVTPGAWEADPLLFVEGPIDALTLAAAGHPAIALFGASNLPSWLPERCAFRSVALALDGDEAGDKGAERLAAALRAMGATVNRLRPNWFKDWNELAPRLVEGLPAVLAAALDDKSPAWDEAAAWQQVRAAYQGLVELVPAGAIPWAEATRPELMVTVDQAEAAINGAFGSEDSAALELALQTFGAVHREVAAAFTARPNDQPAGGDGHDELLFDDEGLQSLCATEGVPW